LIDKRVLDILACPNCDSRPPLRLQGNFLICSECGKGYEIKDGIPDLLPEDAISPEDLKERLDGE